MTREEAKALLENRRDLIKSYYPGIDDYREALDMAIKALEQESILDKIRAEIEHHRHKTQSIDPYDLVGDCLDIIDKYKAESEDKE